MNKIIRVMHNRWAFRVCMFVLAIFMMFLWVVSLETVKAGDFFGLIHPFFVVLTGAFVWGDMLVLSLFWMLVFVVFQFRPSIVKLLTVVNIFWIIRSIGEIFYWMQAQFNPYPVDHPMLVTNWPLIGEMSSAASMVIYQLGWQAILLLNVLIFIGLIRKRLRAEPVINHRNKP